MRALWKRFGLLALVFAVGLAVGLVVSGERGIAHDQPIEVYRISPPGDEPTKLTPYRGVIDGRPTELRESPRGAASVWRIDLEGGRVAFCSPRGYAGCFST